LIPKIFNHMMRSEEVDYSFKTEEGPFKISFIELDCSKFDETEDADEHHLPRYLPTVTEL